VALVAVGKASVPMARAAEQVLGDRLDEGIAVSTPTEGTSTACACSPRATPCPTRGGWPPRPRSRGSRAGSAATTCCSCSSPAAPPPSCPSPAEGVTLEDKARTTSLLLRAGATIHELNAVRKHLSRLKGGGLARAAARRGW
jgi:glycerate 2-kinase